MNFLDMYFFNEKNIMLISILFGMMLILMYLLLLHNKINKIKSNSKDINNSLLLYMDSIRETSNALKKIKIYIDRSNDGLESNINKSNQQIRDIDKKIILLNDAYSRIENCLFETFKANNKKQAEI